MELKEFLDWLTTPGAAWITYELIELVRPLASLNARAKRRATYAISAALAILAYLGLVAMHYEPVPADWRAWVETLFLVGSSAFALSTLLHGERNLPTEPPASDA